MMDDKVKDLLDRIRGTASVAADAAADTARVAGKKAGQMVDVAKLNMRIFDLKTDINGLLREIGQVVYDTHAGAEPDTAPIDGLLTQIDEKNAAIAELRERINLLRSSRTCPGCGEVCGRDDKFCKGCGAPLRGE